MNAAAAMRATPAVALPVARRTPIWRRGVTACCPPRCNSRCLAAVTGAIRAGCRRSIRAITRSAKSREGDKYGSRCHSAPMGTNSSSKSCSIMDSSREDLRVWYGKVSRFSGLFCSEKQVFGGSSEVPQILPQFLPRAVDVGLHRAQRELHYLGDLVVRVVLDMAEDDAGAILGPQPGDRLLYLRPKLPRLQLLEWRLAAARHRHCRRPCTLGGDCVRRAFDADGVDLTPAQVIDGDVVGDLKQPAREFELGPVPVDVVEDLYEGFLGQVFGGLLVKHHPIDER